MAPNRPRRSLCLRHGLRVTPEAGIEGQVVQVAEDSFVPVDAQQRRRIVRLQRPQLAALSDQDGWSRA